jgi:hypothetical protein
MIKITDLEGLKYKFKNTCAGIKFYLKCAAWEIASDNAVYELLIPIITSIT